MLLNLSRQMLKHSGFGPELLPAAPLLKTWLQKTPMQGALFHNVLHKQLTYSRRGVRTATNYAYAGYIAQVYAATHALAAQSTAASLTRLCCQQSGRASHV